MNLGSENYPIRTVSSLSIMYLASFLLLVLFSALMLQIGAPLKFVSVLMLVFVVSSYVFAGMYAKTMVFGCFQYAHQITRPWSISQAIASGAISGGVYVLMAGQFHVSGTSILAGYSGWLVGLGLMTLLFSAHFARTRITTIPTLLAGAADNGWIRGLAMLITVISCLALIFFQLDLLGRIASSLFTIPVNGAIMALMLGVGICIIAGGMQSVIIIRQIAYPVIFLCFMFPVIWMSLELGGLPIPQLSYGMDALVPLSGINQEMVQEALVSTADIFDFTQNGRGLDGFNYLATLFCLAFGIASMPHLIQHFSAIEKGKQARHAGLGAFFLVFVFISAIPAIVAFAELKLSNTLSGLSIYDLASDAGWIFDLKEIHNLDAVQICGQYVVTAEQSIQACTKAGTEILSPMDFGINPDMFVFANAMIQEFPLLITVMVATGALLALLTSVDGLFLAIGLTLLNDGYRRFIRPKAPKSVSLFVSRFLILMAVLCVLVIALNSPPSPKIMFEIAFLLGAGALFPAMVLRIWVPDFKDMSILLALISGVTVSAGLYIISVFGWDWIAANGDETVIFIPGITEHVTTLSIGILGCCAAFLVPIIVNSIQYIISGMKETKHAAT